MNKSGIALKYLVEHYLPDIKNIMVIHDDMDLDAGRLRISRNGSSGGHRGVKSIIHHLGTNEFNRTRIGIGRPRDNEPAEKYVLAGIHEGQEAAINKALQLVAGAVELFVTSGIEAAMNKYNSLVVQEKEV